MEKARERVLQVTTPSPSLALHSLDWSSKSLDHEEAL